MIREKGPLGNAVYEFAPAGDACIIHDPETPRYWYNYLWNDLGWCAQISQIGHGRSYYITDKADMCMLNRDAARYIFLREENENTCWNIGYGPLLTPVDHYRCTHSIGSSLIESERGGIRAAWQIVVPTDLYGELWTLTLTNTGDEAKMLSIFPSVSFSLDGFSHPRYYEMYRSIETVFDQALNGIYCKSSHPFAPHKRYNGYLASSAPVFSYDGDLTAFCGSLSTKTEPDTSSTALFQRPKRLLEGLNCSNSDGALFIPGAVLQHKLTLLPGETREIRLIFGVAETQEEARKTAAARTSAGAFAAALRQAEENYLSKYASLTVRTPDTRINDRMNLWVKKQVDFCIVGKKGVRDNLQIAAALLNYRPDKAKEEILECLRHQFRDGHAVLTWYPYDDTRYSDQPFWIIWAVCELLKETGDPSILDISVAWQDGGEASVLDHVKAAVNRLLDDRGRNGLVRIYFADWNDALNIPPEEEAESVMLSAQFAMALHDLAELMAAFVNKDYAANTTTCDAADTAAIDAVDTAAVDAVDTAAVDAIDTAAVDATDTAAVDATDTAALAAVGTAAVDATGFSALGAANFAAFCAAAYEEMKTALNRAAWDGKWYCRALAKTENIGSRNSTGSKIYLNAQTWPLLADIVPTDRLTDVLSAIDGMERDFGFPLIDPPYASYDPMAGRMSGMLPGLFENGGVYCHASAFKILADCKCGRGDEALRTLLKIMPDSEKNPSAQSGAEPYVFTNCYSTHPKYFGRSYQSWTTGTSGWCLKGLYEGILGIHRSLKGLRIEPAFPSSWDHAEVTRRFRGADYHIVYKRTGTKTVTADGMKCEEGLLPDYRDGQTHEILVTL